MSQPIAPDGEAGYSSIDVLVDAQEGDTITIDFDYVNLGSVYTVHGTVVTVEESEADEQDTREKKIIIDADHPHFEGLMLWVHSSTTAATNYLIDKIDVRSKDTYPDWVTQELGAVHGVELEREESST